MSKPENYEHTSERLAVPPEPEGAMERAPVAMRTGQMLEKMEKSGIWKDEV